MTIALILVEIFTVIMQRNVCEKAFDRKPAGTAVQVMVWAAFYKNIVIRNMDWLEVFIVPVSSIFIVMAMFVPLTDEYVWAKLLASILILIVNLFTFYN